MGHKKRNPTTIATDIEELYQLDGPRGEPDGEPRAAEAFRSMTLQQRILESKTWSSWAEGLKAAISTALNIQCLEAEVSPPAQQPVLRPISQIALEAWKQHFLHDHLPARRDCMHCVRAQGRSFPHRRVSHLDAFALSIDLSGKMVVSEEIKVEIAVDAFLNAPRRDDSKVTAMEVPAAFRKLGLASSNDVSIIEKALYGLVGSPRDWCIYRDETLP